MEIPKQFYDHRRLYIKDGRSFLVGNLKQTRKLLLGHSFFFPDEFMDLIIEFQARSNILVPKTSALTAI